jgi:hypothetical protein
VTILAHICPPADVHLHAVSWALPWWVGAGALVLVAGAALQILAHATANRKTVRANLRAAGFLFFGWLAGRSDWELAHVGGVPGWTLVLHGTWSPRLAEGTPHPRVLPEDDGVARVIDVPYEAVCPWLVDALLGGGR